MQEKIQALSKDLEGKAQSANSLAQIEQLRVEYLGKKGLISDLLAQIAQVPPSDRPQFGKLVNEAKQSAARLLDKCHAVLQRNERENRFRSVK